MNRTGLLSERKNVLKKTLLLLGLILLLTGNVLFWASQKEGFHVDEMFSYEQIGNTRYPKPYYDRPDEPCMNTWHSRAYYEDYLTVSSEEAFQFSAFLESASRNTAHPPLYLVVLGMAVSAVSPDHFTKWSGIALNIVFYVIMLLVLFDLSKRLLKNYKLALLSMFLAGACVGTVSIAVFIRPYMLLGLFTVAFADAHIRMLGKRQLLAASLKKRIVSYVGLMLLFIGGAMSQYYFLVFAFFLCLGYWLMMLITKERRLLLEYTLVMVGSLGLYLYLWPNVLRDLLSEERGVEALNNFMGVEQRYWTEAVRYLREMDRQTTGGFFILILAAFVMLFLFKMIKTHSVRLRFDDGGISVRYTKAERNEGSAGAMNRTIPVEWAGLLLLAVPVISYVLLIAKIAPTLPGEPYKTTRYIACMFPFAVVLFVAFIDRVFLKVLTGRAWRLSIWPVLGLVVFAGYFTSGVNYLYPGTLEQLEQLNAYSEARAVLVTERTYHSSNLNVYFTKHEAVYQTDHAGLLTLSSALESGQDEEIVVYISEETEDAQEVLGIIYQELGASGCVYLFETTGSNRSNVFLIRL